MRFIKKYHGTKRVISKYAWLPITIEGETRWLEKVKLWQSYRTFTYDDDGNFFSDIFNGIVIFIFGGYWKSIEFLEFDESEKRDDKLKKLGI